jgi:hypothetical protein
MDTRRGPGHSSPRWMAAKLRAPGPLHKGGRLLDEPFAAHEYLIPEPEAKELGLRMVYDRRSNRLPVTADIARVARRVGGGT